MKLNPETEIIAKKGSRRTARTHYTALGRSGSATFHFTIADDGNVEFEKVCDGNVWRELSGSVRVEERGTGAEVILQMRGSTKSFEVLQEATISFLPTNEQIFVRCDPNGDGRLDIVTCNFNPP